MNGINISKSAYRDCFEGSVLNETYVLSKEMAIQEWNTIVEERLQTKYEHILINEENITSMNVENWLNSYNDESVKEVETMLLDIHWENKDSIYFCISKYLIIKAKWDEFKKYWRNFLCIDDDSPFLINLQNNDFLLVFTPLGKIKKIELPGRR
jgi:hypothetical protein